MRKKLFLITLIMFMVCTPAFALKMATYKPLDDADGTAISSYALTSGSAVYSEALNMSRNVGFCTLLVTENKAGGAGDVDISVEYSVDGTNWYTAYYVSSPMDGTIAAEGNIVTALGNATRWIVYTPRLTRLMRYKFDPDADSQITATFIFQDEN